MNDFLQRLSNGEILVADGAMGTMLFERGLKTGECPESINLSRLDVLEEIACLYIEAGAEIIQTNTFGGSTLKLAAYGLENKTEEICRNAVNAVRKTVGKKAYISGSCGPCGKILKPYGDTEPEEILDSFKDQMNALIAAGVDLICIETMIDLEEAKLAIKAVRDVSSDIPIMATMTFDTTPDGFFTIMGVTIKQAADGLEEAGANVIGSNCGNGIENMIKIAGEFKAVSSLPIVIQSNAGLPEMKGVEVVYNETPEFMREKARELIQIGVSVIGGCCGTTPEHIRLIKQIVTETSGEQS
jgi:5-methyltetrahydrofolate--homocysteine methyltransferase